MKPPEPCSECGQLHSLFSLACDYPDAYGWLSTHEQQEHAILGPSQCVIRGEEYFVRGCLEIPIIGHKEPMLWGLWVLVHREDFDEMEAHWEMEGREKADGPYLGRLANKLSVYRPSTRNMKVKLRITPVGLRPLIEIAAEEPHELARQQRDGITVAAAQRIVAGLD